MKKIYTIVFMIVLLGLINQVNGQSLKEYKRIKISDGAYLAGIAWDGNHFWVVNRTGTDHVMEIDPSSGDSLSGFPLPGTGTYGLAYYEGHLYFGDTGTDMIYKYTTSGSEVASWDVSAENGATPRDVEFINGKLYYLDSDTDYNMIYELDLANGNKYDFIATKGSNPRGFAFDGKYLWQTNVGGSSEGPEVRFIHKYEYMTFTYLEGIQQSDIGLEKAYGGEWDGNHLWFCNYGVGEIVGYEVTGVTSAKEENKLPTEFVLKQNYPNPFNPSTTIEFQLPEKSFVELKVMNVLGETVKTLISESRKAGIHKVNFNASKLSSGIYFYVLHADKFNSMKKMVLIK